MNDEEEIKELLKPKSNEERIADSLEKIVQLLDAQNKMLYIISNTLRKGR